MSRTSHAQWSDHLLLYGSGLVLIVLGFVLAYQFVEPAPPNKIRITTGEPENAYYQFAKRYSEQLAKEGIELEVVSSAGSIANLERLSATENTVDIAFVQGGVGDTQVHPSFRSLGSLYFEPLWVFHRQGIELKQLAQLSGMRVNIGPDGSGTQAVARRLLKDNGISEQTANLFTLGSANAVDALLASELDVVFIVASPSSSYVRMLLTEPGIELLDFSRAEAYTRHHRFLSAVTLPQGVVDLAENLPQQSITLLAPAATLVVREDFHPALTSLLLQAVRRVHGGGGLFEEPDQFPSARYLDYPLSEEAARFLQSGPSFLQRYLPFWAATLIDRLVVMLVPLVTLMIPLMKVLPPTYRWRVRSRIYRWYDELKDLDLAASQCQDPTQAKKLLQELTQLEQEVLHQQVPKSYADAQYNLRLHLRLIRERLERAQVILQ